jgi:hypothetical protein
VATVTVRPISDDVVQFPQIYPTTPTTHYDKVDETTPNDGTDYVSAAASDGLTHTFRDFYNKQATGIPSGSTINSVTIYIRYQGYKTTLGKIGSCATSIKLGTNTKDGSVTTGTPLWYTKSDTYTTNPWTSAAWTLTDVENLKIGCMGNDVYDTGGEESAPSISTVWLVIDYTPPAAAPHMVGDGLTWIIS